MREGWISIYRKIQDSWLWEDKPFSKGQAWIDILLLANHKDKKTLIGEELIEVKRGSFITSQRKLMQRWGWGSGRTRKFLKLLQADQMIKLLTDNAKTTVFVNNYEQYQNQNTVSHGIARDSKDVRNANGTQTERKRNDNGTQAERNNNSNKNNKGIYSAKNVQNAQNAQQNEQLWKLYPCKKGKARAMQKIPGLIKKYGYGQMENTVTRYRKDVLKRREGGFKNLKYQNGSTFFNGTYMDYLDENYADEAPEHEPDSNFHLFDYNND